MKSSSFNPLKYTYEGTAWRGRRGEKARRERKEYAEARAIDRSAVRLKDVAPDCALEWINKTFGGNLDYIPKGQLCNGSHCPLANAIALVTGDGNEYIEVNEYDIRADGKNYSTPDCVAAFVRNFDNKRYPQYVSYDYDFYSEQD
jgi:hypothetical protein